MGIPAFADSYEWLLKGINAGFAARSAVSVYDEKLVHGAERVVTSLEIARDGSFCKEKEKDPKPKTYKEIASEFIDEITTVDFVEKFIGTMILTQALAKAGVKLDAAHKA